jgi:cobalt-zinc-cadmium efflux system membrane fusion protein
MQRAAELELAKRLAEWDRARATGVRQLVTAIQSGQSPTQIRDSFTDQQLGAAREKLLSAYSDQLLAQSMVSRIETAADTGALPARTVDERRRKVESSGAVLQGIIEQTLFDAERAAQSAEIAMEDARRRWEIATGRVSTLLGVSNGMGDPAEPRTGTETKSVTAVDSAALAGAHRTDPQDLSSIEIRSPRKATVEQKLFNENERVEAGSELFVLADTSKLWVRADLRESQWTALALKPGQEIEVTSPALPDERLRATVVMMGREVDPQTNAIALVASIENTAGRLRPGLYVRVQLPLGETASKVVIPEAAVATHSGETFVFATSDGHTFDRRDVRLGESHEGFVEVIAGVEAGERIAVTGVFTLKSELLLEVEE